MGGRSARGSSSVVNIIVRPAAVVDIQAAGKYYDDEVPGLADDLITELDQLFERLAAFPRSAPLVAGYEPVRRARLRRFPYGVFYQPRATQIEVLRVVHRSRSPGTWRDIK